MWSSGGLDDLVNHSCNPNLGLWQRGGDTFLWSMRDIREGEELSFDYSTSMMDEPWSMECACGEPACRGVIANSLDLPLATLQYYAGMGLLPEHGAEGGRPHGPGALGRSPARARAHRGGSFSLQPPWRSYLVSHLKMANERKDAARLSDPSL